MKLNFIRHSMIRAHYCYLVATLLLLPVSAIAESWVYTVRSGDNLWNITKNHLKGMQYIQPLQRLNHVQNPNKILPGAQLNIPVAWTRIIENVSARIISVHGTVFIQQDNQEKILAAPGMQLFVNNEVQSENDSFATIEFADHSTMRLQNNSRVRLEEMKAFGDHGLVDTLIYLEEGRTENTAPKESVTGTRFRIRTPSAISSVRGTNFRVGTVESRPETSSEVLSGKIQVIGAKKQIKVSAGYGTVTVLNKPPAPPVALLPPPDLSDTPDYYERLPLVIHLNPLPGAGAYRAQIATDKTFTHMVSEFVATTLPFRDGDIPDGDYWLRVRGIDDSGIEGKDAQMPFTLNARPEPPFVISPLPDGVLAPDNQELSWTKQPDVSHYTVLISENENVSDPVYFNPEITTDTITLPTLLEPGHYFWRIAAVSPHEGAGPYSDTMSFRVPYPGPSLEDTQIDKDNDEITFAWRAATADQRFHFQLAHDSSFTTIIYDEIISESRITVPKPEGGTYYMRIKTIESDGFNGPWGTPQTIEIPGETPYWLMLLLLLPFLALI